MVFIKKNFYYLYSFLLAVQLILVIHYVLEWLTGYFHIPAYDYYQSVVLYFNGYKKLELIEYMITVFLLGIFFAIMFFGKGYFEKKTKFSALYLTRSPSGIFFVLFVVLLTGAFFRMGSSYAFVKISLSTLLFVGLIWLPWFMKRIVRQGRTKRIDHWLSKLSLGKAFYVSLIVFGYIQLVGIFYEPIFHQTKIITEYWNVNELTRLDSNQTVDKETYLGTILQKANVDDVTLKDLTRFNLSKKQLNTDVSSIDLHLTNQENEFLKKNLFELHWQVLSRFMIHHNSFMYIPIKELEMKKDIQSINAQYGLGSTWIFSKLFALSNGVSIEKWLQLSYAVYYVYFAFFLLITYLLTRDIAITAIVFLLALASVNLRGYDFLILPPGESPWRHFFDLWVVFLLYYFGKTQKIVFYWGALLFGIVSIAINPQIGIMIYVPVIVTGLIFVAMQKKSFLSISIGILVATIMAFFVFNLSSSANDLAKYYIDGVIGFPISAKQMLVFLVLIALGYTVVLKILPQLSRENILPLSFLFFYAQELLVYVVWHYNGDGLKARAFIYILTIALMLYYLSISWSKKLQRGILFLATVYAVFTYSKSINNVQHSKKEYNKIFDTHAVYEWNMKRAHFVSTMNPRGFQNGIDLIQKYSSDQNGIYIISEYDNLLPFLADKYSMMPFFDLKWYLITPKELNKSIKTIQTNQPEYIFVDSNINRDYEKEVIDLKTPIIGYLHQESVWRVQRLMLLKQIFDTVETEYELIEKGTLISVYKRKDTHETH